MNTHHSLVKVSRVASTSHIDIAPMTSQQAPLDAFRCKAGLHSMQCACSAAAPPPCHEEVPQPCANGTHIVFRRCCNPAAPPCMATVHSYCEGFTAIAGMEPQRHLVPHRCSAKPPKCGQCAQLRRRTNERLQLEADLAKCALLTLRVQVHTLLSAGRRRSCPVVRDACTCTAAGIHWYT